MFTRTVKHAIGVTRQANKISLFGNGTNEKT